MWLQTVQSRTASCGGKPTARGHQMPYPLQKPKAVSPFPEQGFCASYLKYRTEVLFGFEYAYHLNLAHDILVEFCQFLGRHPKLVVLRAAYVLHRKLRRIVGIHGKA